jgi:hypothetical protein
MAENDIPVSLQEISSISTMMENKEKIAKSPHLVQDDSINTRAELKEALKQARVPGNAQVEWTDEQGDLRASVIDFLCEQKVKAVDPNSGQEIIVAARDIPDHAWRLLY